MNGCPWLKEDSSKEGPKEEVFFEREMQQLPDPDCLCECGSGKKYEFCCLGKKARKNGHPKN